MKSLPNILTFSRVIVIPLIIASFYISDQRVAQIVAASLFIFASITDFFDGYLARVWNAQSNLGKFLDPIADKLLVVSSLVMLIYTGRADILPSLAILLREITVSGLREFLAEIKVSVPVSKLAKIKTAVQMSAIFWLLLGTKGLGLASYGMGLNYVDEIANSVLWIAAGLTLFTGFAYLKSGLKHIGEK